MLVNPRPKLEMFSAEDVEKIHQASLRILAEIGYVFHCEEALDILEATPGTRVARDEDRVWFDPKLVEASIANCPSEFTIYARNPTYNRTIGGNYTTMMPAGGCPFTHDRERGRRPGRLSDVIELMKIVHQLPETDGSGFFMVAMQDVPVPLRPVVTEYVNYIYSDKTSGVSYLSPQAGEVDRDLIADFKESVQAIFGSDWDYIAKPVTFNGVNSISPLMFDDRMSLSIIYAARCGQPNVLAPAVMGGISGPMTFAGMMAQQNAEVLAGIVLAQAVRPGVPVVYGDVSTVSDMKVGAPVYGSPEHALSVSFAAQIARRYGIPSRGGGSLTDSKLPDVQAGYERMLTLMSTVMSGINIFWHGAGMMESYLCSSYELLMLDQDVWGMVKAFVEGMKIDDESIAFDVIKEVGPQGMFLTTAHTYETFKGAYFEPKLADRQIYAEWVKRGTKSAEERATEAWKQLLEQYDGPGLPLDDQVVRLYQERIRRAESMLDDVESWPRHLIGLDAAGVGR